MSTAVEDLCPVVKRTCVLWATGISVVSHTPLEVPQIDFPQRNRLDEIFGDGGDLASG